MGQNARRRIPRRIRRDRDAGSSLIEILVSSAMLSVTLLGIYGLIIYSSRSFGLAEGVLETQQSVRFVVDRIGEETRWADAVLPDFRCRPTLLCSDRVILHIPSSNPLRPGWDYQVEYSFDRTGRTVVRRQGQETGILGGGFAEVTFRFLTAQETPAERPEDVARVQISATAVRPSGQARKTLQTDIALRNLRPGAGGAPVAAQNGPSRWRPAPHSVARARPSASLNASGLSPVAPPSAGALVPSPAARPPATAPLRPPAVNPSPVKRPAPPPAVNPSPAKRPASPPVAAAVRAQPPAVVVSRAKGTPADVLYVVQVSVVATREAAVRLGDTLRRAGFEPYFVSTGSGYAVRLGAFRDRARAIRIADQARTRGFHVTVLTSP